MANFYETKISIMKNSINLKFVGKVNLEQLSKKEEKAQSIKKLNSKKGEFRQWFNAFESMTEQYFKTANFLKNLNSEKYKYYSEQYTMNLDQMDKYRFTLNMSFFIKNSKDIEKYLLIYDKEIQNLKDDVITPLKDIITKSLLGDKTALKTYTLMSVSMQKNRTKKQNLPKEVNYLFSLLPKVKFVSEKSRQFRKIKRQVNCIKNSFESISYRMKNLDSAVYELYCKDFKPLQNLKPEYPEIKFDFDKEYLEELALRLETDISESTKAVKSFLSFLAKRMDLSDNEAFFLSARIAKEPCTLGISKEFDENVEILNKYLVS
jgi:hypothetical protein